MNSWSIEPTFEATKVTRLERSIDTGSILRASENLRSTRVVAVEEATLSTTWPDGADDPPPEQAVARSTSNEIGGERPLWSPGVDHIGGATEPQRRGSDWSLCEFAHRVLRSFQLRFNVRIGRHEAYKLARERRQSCLGRRA